MSKDQRFWNRERTDRPAYAGDRHVEPSEYGAQECGTCGAPMVKKTNGKTGERFWSCTRYPDCKGSRNV